MGESFAERGIMRCIILDGYHQGTILNMDFMPMIKLAVPHRITTCNCGDLPEDFDYGPEIKEYKLAAKGYDDCALYSTSGDLYEAMTKMRDWIVNPNHLQKRSPIYFHCREELTEKQEKAFVPAKEYLSLEEHEALLKEEQVRADVYEKCANQWMEDYQRLKDKYEPMILTKGGINEFD